ncbi:MAG TPA: amidase [Solirubrobacterales bacterium]|jgi:amidase|nr:amidase [Solirubrobacterales bacterium]
MIDGLEGMDGTAQAQLVRDGELSPVELAEAAIERAERLNPDLNAIIHPLYDEGRAAAAGELPDGPFRGVPFLLKDIGAALAGQPLHMGCEALKRAAFRAPVDTYLGARFRDAGFVTIGKTNVPEFGILPTTEPAAYGASCNPWDLGRTTGGSSGGSAAAVAAGIVPIAHANDGGGSIRIPASCCGLVGLKPTRQRISEGPLIGDVMSGLTVELVLARSVRDVATVLEEVEGPAPGDPYVAPPPLRPYREELVADPGRLRIGLLTEAIGSEIEVSPVVSGAARGALELLGSLGHEVDDDAPEVPQGGPFDPIETFMTRWYAGQTATNEQFEVILGRPLEPGDVEPLTWAMAEEGRRRNAGQYLVAVGVHQAIARLLADWFEAGHDLLLTPTLGEPPPPLGTFDDSGDDPLRAIVRAQPMGVFTAVFNATGNPAISLPLHWTDDGIPVGIQLVAPFGREDVLIRVAAQLEKAQPWAERHPPLWAGADRAPA